MQWLAVDARATRIVTTLLRECGARDFAATPTSSDERHDVVLSDARWTRLFRGVDGDALPPWAFGLSADQCRAVIGGLHVVSATAPSSPSNGNKAMALASPRLRDDVLRLMLHAGYSAAFASHDDDGGGGAWRIEFGAATACGEPLVATRTRRDAVRVVRKYAGRTWCFDMNDGFVVVRRAARPARAGGAVTRASRPTIQGNW